MLKKIILLIILFFSNAFADGDNLLTLLPGDDFFGKKDAPIVMITYDAPSCPHCAHFNMDVIPMLKKNFADDVLFIHRDFPMDTASLYVTLLLKCLDIEQARKIRLLLFQSQPKWVMSRTKDKLLNNIYDVIKISGINREQYDSCMNNIELSAKVVQEKEEVIKKVGVYGTPTHFINGKKYEGNQSFDFFAEIFNEIKQKQKLFNEIKQKQIQNQIKAR